MARRGIDPGAGEAAVRAWLEHREASATHAAEEARPLSRHHKATAVRYALELFANAHPGGSVEIRVPPFGAVQAIAGVRHTRGTPPAIVETTADAFLALAVGELTVPEAQRQGVLSASGERSDLSSHLPLAQLTALAERVHNESLPAPEAEDPRAAATVHHQSRTADDVSRNAHVEGDHR